jgi:hypothetical protein
MGIITDIALSQSIGAVMDGAFIESAKETLEKEESTNEASEEHNVGRGYLETHSELFY